MAAPQVETVSTAGDKAKLAAAVALVIAALAAFYRLTKQGQIAQWGALVLGLAAAVGVFFTSEPGKELFALRAASHFAGVSLFSSTTGIVEARS